MGHKAAVLGKQGAESGRAEPTGEWVVWEWPKNDHFLNIFKVLAGRRGQKRAWLGAAGPPGAALTF